MMKTKHFLALFVLLLLNSLCCQAFAADESGFFKLSARIMSIDLDENLAIIAEKEFKLLSHNDEQGKKIWETVFVDKDGNQITPDQLEERSRVLVRGYNNGGGTITANEIIVLE